MDRQSPSISPLPWSRRDRARRRRLRALLALGAVSVLVGLVAGFVAAAAPAGAGWGLLASPGVLLPVAWLALTVALVAGLRARYARVRVTLDEQLLTATPGLLRRAFPGIPARTLAWSDVTAVQGLEVREGAFLAVHGPEGSPPVLLPLAAAGAAGWVDGALRRAPAGTVAAGLEDRAGQLARVPALDPSPPARWPDPTVRFLEAAGLWTLAAEALWPRVLDRPDDGDLARRLLHVESRRLPLGMRVRLGEALLQHAPTDSGLLFELARLYLAVRWVPVAQAVLERLAASPDAPRPTAHWSAVLRDRRAVPAPAPRPSFGFEVGPPRHRLVGDVLRVDDQHPVSLDWFVGYRLVPGFWGPPRQLELVDVWGRRWGLGGEALPLAAALGRAAPHLGDLHDVGLLWPGTTGRIRRLHRAAPARSGTGAP